MIDVKSINKAYGKGKNKSQVLRDISFQINEGESVAIIGKSGSGKSTLMHIISGLDRADSGDVKIQDHSIGRLSDRELDHFRNEVMGFIFQTFFLIGNESVLENTMLPLIILGEGIRTRRDKAMEALKKVGLEDKAQAKAKDLSGGQKQRVCIARAIINNPSIIFADEPTGNLDTETGEKIINLLFDLNRDLKSTLFIVTHDYELSKRCQKQILIRDGQIEKPLFNY